MNEHEATEVAYKNGYQKGTLDTALKMQSEIKERCLKKGIYPVVVAMVVDQVAKELSEEQSDAE